MMCLSWSQRSTCLLPGNSCPSILLFWIGLGVALFAEKGDAR